MPSFGDIIYNITDMYVAALTGSTYGTPARVEYVQSFSFEFESDEDTIKAYGLNVETLSIPIGGTGTIAEASLSWGAMAVMTGNSESSSGSTPNGVKQIDMLAGGAGLPYFGVIASYAAVEGNALIGFPKCKLVSLPAFTVEQNQFRASDMGIKMVAPSAVIRKLMRLKKNETAATVPTSSGDFGTFFTGMFA